MGEFLLGIVALGVYCCGSFMLLLGYLRGRSTWRCEGRPAPSPYRALPHVALHRHNLPYPVLPYLPLPGAYFRSRAVPIFCRFYLEMQGLPGMPLEEVSAKLSKVTQVFLDEGLQLDRWGIHRVALA